MIGKVLLSQQDTGKKSRKQQYFSRIQGLHQYVFKACYFSFNGNISYLLITEINKRLVILASLKLILITSDKFVKTIFVGINTWLDSLVEDYLLTDFKNNKKDNLLEDFAVTDVVSNLTGQSDREALEAKWIYVANYSLLKMIIDYLKQLPGNCLVSSQITSNISRNPPQKPTTYC